MGYSTPKSSIDESGFNLPEEGWHRFRASHTEERKTRDGDRMYHLRLYSLDSGSFLTFDNIVLGGRGGGIGLKKMQAIDCVEDLGDSWDFCYPHEVDGATGWCYISHYDYDRRQKRAKDSGSRQEDLERRAQVDIRFGEAGYQHRDWSPAGTGVGGGRQDFETPPEDDDSSIPF